jgi:hypothetical protein
MSLPFTQTFIAVCILKWSLCKTFLHKNVSLLFTSPIQLAYSGHRNLLHFIATYLLHCRNRLLLHGKHEVNRKWMKFGYLEQKSCSCAYLIKHYAMKAYGGVDVWIHIFLTSALVRGEWSASSPGRFIPSTHWIGDWVDHRSGLDDVEKRKFLTLLGLELRPLGRSARRQSLYQLLLNGLINTFSEFLLSQRY